MIGMTQLVVTSTSELLLQELRHSYQKNDIITGIEKNSCNFSILFPTNIHNEEKEGIFEAIVQKIRHLKDPGDKLMETKIEVKYLQQASKEYYFSRGDLVRYRGFVDTDNPIPMVTELLLNVDK